MGKRGPAPTSTAILKARGSWLPGTRHGEPEVSEPMIFAPPSWLTNEDAIACWNEMRPIVSWLRKSDENLFARYCEAWGRYRERLRELAASVTRDAKESLDARIAKINEQMIRMEAQIGMTPSARTGIRVDDKPKNKGKVRLIRGQRAQKEAGG